MAALPESSSKKTEEDLKIIEEGLVFIGREKDIYLKHLSTINNREIKELSELTENEIKSALAMMSAWIGGQKKKLEKASKEKTPEQKLDETLGLQNENNTAN